MIFLRRFTGGCNQDHARGFRQSSNLVFFRIMFFWFLFSFMMIHFFFESFFFFEFLFFSEFLFLFSKFFLFQFLLGFLINCVIYITKIVLIKCVIYNKIYFWKIKNQKINVNESYFVILCMFIISIFVIISHLFLDKMDSMVITSSHNSGNWGILIFHVNSQIAIPENSNLWN